MFINEKKNAIELSKKEAAAAAKFGTREYKALQEARKDYPGFKVVTITRKSTIIGTIGKAKPFIHTSLMNKNENKYLIDGKTEDKDTVEKYFDNWFENTPNANWLKIEE